MSFLTRFFNHFTPPRPAPVLLNQDWTPAPPGELTKQLQAYHLLLMDYWEMDSQIAAWYRRERDLEIRLIYARLEPWGA